MSHNFLLPPSLAAFLIYFSTSVSVMFMLSFIIYIYPLCPPTINP